MICSPEKGEYFIEACAGTGKVGQQALAHGKHVVYFEEDIDQLDGIKERLNNMASDFYVPFKQKLIVPERFMLLHKDDQEMGEACPIYERRYLPAQWIMSHTPPTIECVIENSNTFESLSELSAEFQLFNKVWTDNAHVRVRRFF